MDSHHKHQCTFCYIVFPSKRSYSHQLVLLDTCITYCACTIQALFTKRLVVTEFFPLATMSCGHYVAIYKPLNYTTTWAPGCRRVMFCSWMAALLIILTPFSLSQNLEFGGSNVIYSLFCDGSPFLKALMLRYMGNWADGYSLWCADLHYNISFCSSLLHMHNQIRFLSSQQRRKAFPICYFLVIVVSITYGSWIFIHSTPSAKESVAINKVVIELTTFIAPLLTPFIYTLRNQQEKQAFNDPIKRITFSKKKRNAKIDDSSFHTLASQSMYH